MNDGKSVLIVGTGALASLFGARLSAAGFDVTLLGTWEQGLNALRQVGIRLQTPDGERVYSVKAVRSPTETGKFAYALILVKSWQTERAARQLVEILEDDGLALTLQNGIGNREILTRILGQDRVVQGATTTGATLLGPGHVRPGGEGVITVEGHPGFDPLIEKLRAAGFRVDLVDDVEGVLWRKLMINVAINPMTAILGVPNGELINRPSALQLMKDAVQEVKLVAQAEGVDLGLNAPFAAAENVARKTASNRSSMLQDVSRGAPTEIDVICGAVIRAGERHGIATPVNRTLYLLIKSLVEEKGTL